MRGISAGFGWPAAVFAWLAFAPAVQARPLDEVKASGYLRVTVYRNLKPFSWIEDGKPHGIDVDIAAAYARALGVRVEYLDLRADDRVDDDLRNGVWKGSVVGDAPGDVMMHVPYDKALEARNDLVKLQAPYHSEGLAMAIAPDKAQAAQDFSLFETEKVGVDVGSLADFVLVSVRERKLLPNITHFRGTQKAFDAFEQGEVAAVYGQDSIVEPLARAARRKNVLMAPTTSLRASWQIGLAVRINSRDLGYALADITDGLMTSGEMARIFEGYQVTWKKPQRAE